MRAAIAAVQDEHRNELDHELTLVDALAISRGKTTDVDLRVAYTGTMSMAEQDGLRASTFAELRDRIGPIHLTLVFTQYPIHETPRPAAATAD